SQSTTTDIYTLSLHDALPISICTACQRARGFISSCVTQQGPASMIVVATATPCSSNNLVIPSFRPRIPWITSGLDSRSQLDLDRSEEHTSELQSRFDLVCRLL